MITDPDIREWLRYLEYWVSAHYLKQQGTWHLIRIGGFTSETFPKGTP